MQLNVIVEKANAFGYFKNIGQERVYLPFAWLEEGVPEPSEVSAEKISLYLKYWLSVLLWLPGITTKLYLPFQIVAEKMTFLLELPENIKTWQTLGLSGLGILLILPQVWLWIKNVKCGRHFCISL